LDFAPATIPTDSRCSVRRRGRSTERRNFDGRFVAERRSRLLANRTRTSANNVPSANTAPRSSDLTARKILLRGPSGKPTKFNGEMRTRGRSPFTGRYFQNTVVFRPSTVRNSFVWLWRDSVGIEILPVFPGPSRLTSRRQTRRHVFKWLHNDGSSIRHAARYKSTRERARISISRWRGQQNEQNKTGVACLPKARARGKRRAERNPRHRPAVRAVEMNYCVHGFYDVRARRHCPFRGRKEMCIITRRQSWVSRAVRV